MTAATADNGGDESGAACGCAGMAELELSRASDDRRLYTRGGVGSIRFKGLLSHAATAESRGRRWHLSRHGIWGGRSTALDETGATAGRFEPRGVRRGGAISWGDRELTLRPVLQPQHHRNGSASRRRGLARAALKWFGGGVSVGLEHELCAVRVVR